MTRETFIGSTQDRVRGPEQDQGRTQEDHRRTKQRQAKGPDQEATRSLFSHLHPLLLPSFLLSSSFPLLSSPLLCSVVCLLSFSSALPLHLSPSFCLPPPLFSSSNLLESFCSPSPLLSCLTSFSSSCLFVTASVQMERSVCYWVYTGPRSNT